MAGNSLNICIDFFLDSLTGRSPETKRNYERDLYQFKLYLVLFRPHTLVKRDEKKLQKLRDELEKGDGKLWETAILDRNYKTDVHSQTALDAFDIRVDRLRKEDIVGYFGYLETSRGLGRATLLRRLASLRRFFQLLSKEGFDVPAQIVDHLEDMHIKRERPVPMALTAEESYSFLSAIENELYRSIILVFLFMGLRVS